MKILKPGKVEMKRFVCPACECEFEAGASDTSYSLGYYVLCPCCNNKLWWIVGEPYEEPVQDDRERLMALLDGNCGYTECERGR